MIGDKVTDIQAGKSAGCRTILFNPNAAEHIDSQADEICRTWAEIAQSLARASRGSRTAPA
jgi:phosphoglycolate phosphatase-like HAD superfamily hydrolase